MPTPVPIVPGVVLSASHTQVFGIAATEPATKRVKITSVRFVNVDTEARTVTVNVLAGAGASSAENLRFKTLIVPPASDGGPPPSFDMDDVILKGGSIWASASVANMVTMVVNGESYP